jgi:XTP/dITP diphosphohydrolase
MDKTAAELTPEIKHSISHRGQAVQLFLQQISGYLNNDTSQ